jgi:hypothetical protein
MTFKQSFSNPYEVDNSYQLSGITIGKSSLDLIGFIEDADKYLENNEYKKFIICFRKITSCIPNLKHRQMIMYRIIYNYLNLKSFEPVISSFDSIDVSGMVDLSLTTIQQKLTLISKKYVQNTYGKDVLRTNFSWRQNKQKITLKANVNNEKKKINYIHLDEKKGITTIMYLSDVTETDGPFRYVKGSHDAPCSYILKALHEFMSCDLKINSPEQMKDFPAEYRQSINYYDFLETEKKKSLDQLSVSVLGQRGTIVSFAGNRLLHGGGSPTAGARSALFVQHVGLFRQRFRVVFHLLNIASRLNFL